MKMLHVLLLLFSDSQKAYMLEDGINYDSAEEPILKEITNYVFVEGIYILSRNAYVLNILYVCLYFTCIHRNIFHDV